MVRHIFLFQIFCNVQSPPRKGVHTDHVWKKNSGTTAIELANKEFLESVARAIRHGGVMSAPADSFWLDNFQMEDTINECCKIFKGSVRYAWSTVPSYSRYQAELSYRVYAFSLCFFFFSSLWRDEWIFNFFPLAGRLDLCCAPPTGRQSTLRNLSIL